MLSHKYHIHSLKDHLTIRVENFGQEFNNWSLIRIFLREFHRELESAYKIVREEIF